MLALKWPVRSLMRAVSRATCTSGEPVSAAARWYSWTICAFCAVFTAMVYSFEIAWPAAERDTFGGNRVFYVERGVQLKPVGWRSDVAAPAGHCWRRRGRGRRAAAHTRA